MSLNEGGVWVGKTWFAVLERENRVPVRTGNPIRAPLKNLKHVENAPGNEAVLWIHLATEVESWKQQV
jgi:hypothetical protein